MRKTAAVLFGFLLVLGAVVLSQNVSMPDYSTWEKTADHAVAVCIYKGKKIELHDEHYEYVNPEGTETSVVMVFHDPDTDKPWFAVYERSSKNDYHLYLFDANQEGNRIFVQEGTSLTTKEKDELLRSRYDLVFDRRQ